VSVFLQLAKNTFRECLREPVYFMTLAAGLLLTGSIPAATLFVFQKPIWMVLDTALALILLLGFVTAVLCSSHCIRREMTNGTVLLLLSKPVSRFVFIAAKIAGVNAALGVFALIFCSGAVIVCMSSAGVMFFESWGIACYYAIFSLSCLYGALCNYFRHEPFASRTVFALAVGLPVFTVATYAITAGAVPIPDTIYYIS